MFLEEIMGLYETQALDRISLKLGEINKNLEILIEILYKGD